MRPNDSNEAACVKRIFTRFDFSVKNLPSQKYCFLQKNYTFTQLVFIIDLIPISQLETVWTQPTITGPVMQMRFILLSTPMYEHDIDRLRKDSRLDEQTEQASSSRRQKRLVYNSQCRMRPYCNRDLQQ